MVNYNGELIADTADFLEHSNRGFRWGDALFEEVRVIDGRPVFWEAHYFKLMASMRILRMEIPASFTMEYLEEQLVRTVKANALETLTALVRISVFRLGGAVLSAIDEKVGFIMDGAPMSNPFYQIQDAPYEVEIFKDYYLNADMLSNLDTTDKLLQVIASVYATENGYQDCLLVNGNKQVVATIYGNLFLLSGTTLKTPPLQDGCTNGVIRKEVIEIVEHSGEFEMAEASISPFELQKADELFVVNVKEGIIPITKYRKKEYDSQAAKALIGKLNARARFSN